MIWSGRASPACFTVRRVIALLGAPYPTHWKSSGMKAVLISSSTGRKTSPIPGVTRCTNAHSCWSELYSPAYADCGCLRATPANGSFLLFGEGNNGDDHLVNSLPSNSTKNWDNYMEDPVKINRATSGDNPPNK